ncbi:hypothetical protein TNCV_1490581 [Trichonephila clavipes]|nr:hypothetical protein TNCV_1490581 [Trichonephila clavipes]
MVTCDPKVVLQLWNQFQTSDLSPERTHSFEEFHEEADIHRMDKPSRSPDHNSIEHVWDGLEKSISEGSSPPRAS